MYIDKDLLVIMLHVWKEKVMAWYDILLGGKVPPSDEDVEDTVVEPTTEEERRAALQREKEEATERGEAWVAVIDTQVNPADIKNGFFELDWNNEFIEQLLDAGYTGESAEDIVNAWFTTIVYQMIEEDNPDAEKPDTGYVKIVPGKNGRSSIS